MCHNVPSGGGQRRGNFILRRTQAPQESQETSASLSIREIKKIRHAPVVIRILQVRRIIGKEETKERDETPRSTLPPLNHETERKRRDGRSKGAQRREVATCGYSLSVVKCYYKRRDLYERRGPSREEHADGSAARILGNDFTFTPWLSSPATF